MRMQIQSLALLSGLGIRRCCELLCRLQTQLRSGVAVAVASGYSSDLTPSLGTSICRRLGPKKDQKKKNSLPRSSCHDSVETNLTSIHEDADSIPGLA